MKKALALLAIALLFVSSAVYAQTTVLQTSFDVPAYTTGSAVGQNGWAGTASQTQIVDDGTGNQFFEMVSGSTNYASLALPGTYSSNVVRLKFDWMWISTDTNSVASGGAGTLGTHGLQIILNNSSSYSTNRAVWFTAALNSDKATGIFGAYSVSKGWQSFGSFNLGQKYTVEMNYNIDTKIYNVAINGGIIASGIGAASSTASTVNYLQVWGRYYNGNFGLDNLSVTVPEPSSILALLCGGIGMVGFVVRRKK
jgi:hypothetical protein